MNYEDKWQAERERAGFLALADGAVFRGVAFGAREDRLGEAVFNTGMSGYQEIATDPSYAGQIVALTTAEVGNYGTNPDDAESRGLFLSGLVVNDLAEPSNFRSTLPLDKLLADAGIPGLRGLDTRSLTLHLRDHGSQRAYLHVSDEPLAPAVAVERARSWEGLDGQDYAAKVSCKTAYDFPHAESAEFVSHAESAENAETSSFAAERHPSFAPQAHPSFVAERHPSFGNPLAALYARFSDAEHAAEIARLLTPPRMRAQVSVVYQTVPALHAALSARGTPPPAASNGGEAAFKRAQSALGTPATPASNARDARFGDWYFTGDYPTPGGYRVLRRSLENHLARREGRSY